MATVTAVVMNHPSYPTETLRLPKRTGGAHGVDPLQLTLVFGIDEKTAICQANSACALLGEAAEQPAQ
ncbi:hypothetical protein ACH4U7_53045 [Streptomyces sp. NPDC020845]|uniref:hypothetical protein n=1 Tax=Streptomyces sp. NPDC020845 TaxID=3365096 RepID=UPI0037B5BEB4